jgi:autotransporter passenger strand-loop-strand repeat protein
LEVFGGATNTAATYGSGATLVVGSGFTQAGFGVANGVTVVVSSSGSASGTTISSGGTEVVSSGGALDGATLAGGTLEITSGAILGSGTIGYASGGVLRLDDSQSFGTTISGFGIPGGIDLVDVAYNSATTTLNFQEAISNLSGTLTVNDGAHVATLTLLGQYVTGQFHMANDGHGGTMVTDPPVDSAGHLASPH